MKFLQLSVRRFSAVWLFVIFFTVFSILQPAVFPTVGTAQLVLSAQVAIALISFALLIPFVAGSFDLSVGATMAFSMVILTVLQQNTDLDIVSSCIVAVLAGALVGAVNGFLVVKLRVSSFIATLGISQVLLALTLLISENRQISGVFPDGFTNFTRMKIFGFSLDIFYLLIIAVIIWYVLEHTATGRYLYAIGGNPEAARLSGVPVDRLVWGSLIASGTIAGFAGVIYASQIGLFSTSFGAPFLFPAFAAVFFGATQIKDRPNVWGTLIAVVTLAFGAQGLQLVFYAGGYWITPLFNGIALVVAVSFASYRAVVPGLRRRKTKQAETKTEAIAIAEALSEREQAQDSSRT